MSREPQGGPGKEKPASSSSRQRVGQSPAREPPSSNRLLSSSLVTGEPARKPPAEQKPPPEAMKVHRGPLNLSAITMRDPGQVYADIVAILDELGVSNKRASNFSVKCEYKELKFVIEINLVEKFANIFVIKFYKNNQAHTNYFELCSAIFSKLNL